MADLERRRGVQAFTAQAGDVSAEGIPGSVTIRLATVRRTWSLVLSGLLLVGAGRASRAQDARPGTAEGTAALLDSLRPGIERAVVRAEWSALDTAIARLRTAVAAAPRDAALHYELGYALHRRASALIVEERRKQARPLLEESERALARAGELGGGGSALALRGAVTGQMAGVGGLLTAMRDGPRAFRQLDEAIRLAPGDPRVALLNGITRLNAPRAFGGGPSKAEPELRRAIALFADDRPDSPAPSWGHADAWIWLGIALEQQDRREDARAALDEALAIAPGHAWVTRVLRPRLEESASGRNPTPPGS